MKKTLLILFTVPLGILTMLTGIYIFSREEPLFSVKHVKINGAALLRERDIIARVSPFLKENLFTTDISKIKDAITAHPFVRGVRIKRVFPFSIVIDVEEKKPSALWVQGDGEIRVLDEHGEQFKGLTKGDMKDLFIINAKGKEDAKSIFREINSWLTEGIIKKDILSDVAYEEGNITLFCMDDGVEIVLGKEDQKGRLKRALAVLEDAKKRGLLIRCIDARFERGAIVQERKG